MWRQRGTQRPPAASGERSKGDFRGRACGTAHKVQHGGGPMEPPLYSVFCLLPTGSAPTRPASPCCSEKEDEGIADAVFSQTR